MNTRWEKDGANHVLYFTPYYDEEKIAIVFCEEDGGWYFTSDLLNTNAEYLGCDKISDAKEAVERLVEEHYEDERNYFQDLLEKWKETD